MSLSEAQIREIVSGEIKKAMRSIYTEMDALGKQIDALNKQLNAQSTPSRELIAINKQETRALVTSTMKEIASSIAEVAVSRALDVSRKEFAPKITALEEGLTRTMSHLMYTTSDVETETRNYQLAALRESESSSGGRRRITDGSNAKHEIIPGAVRMVFTDDD